MPKEVTIPTTSEFATSLGFKEEVKVALATKWVKPAIILGSAISLGAGVAIGYFGPNLLKKSEIAANPIAE